MEITPYYQIIFTYLFVLIGGFLVFSAISHILYQKRSPTSMTSWIFAIFFMPYIAVPLYFIIGIRKRRSDNEKDFLHFHEVIGYDQYIYEEKGGITGILKNNAIPPATIKNSFELITNDVEAYERMLKEIHNAKESIDMCTYVFKFDKTTEVILDALIYKAKEGVKVRLLIDLIGSLGASFNKKRFHKLITAGGEVEFFVPILKRPFQNYINLREHRKIYLFDRKRLLSGGMNLSNEYMGTDDGIERWDDLMYYLEGPEVPIFYSIFHNDWEYATKTEEEVILSVEGTYNGDCIAQAVPSGPDMEHDGLYEVLLNAIYSAKERIWIVTPYFVPDENIIQALIIAFHKGVDVKLITPKVSNHKLADMARSSYMRELDDIGADVLLHNGAMLHAKAMLIDDIGGMVGSLNLDNRSLFLNYEVVTFITSDSFVASIESWMQTLMSHSTRGMEKPSKLREASENIMKVFAPLI